MSRPLEPVAETSGEEEPGPAPLRIKGLPPGSTAAAEIVTWLEGRDEVLEVATLRESGIIEVTCRAAADESALRRSLEDQVAARHVPRSPRLPDLEILHLLAGRLRLRLVGDGADAAPRLALWLTRQPGVLRTQGNPASGSVLVLFDPTIITAQAIVVAARTSSPSVWPVAPELGGGKALRQVVATSVVMAACATGVVPLPLLSAATALTAIPTVRRSVRALRERRASVDLLDAAAIGVSLASAQPTTAAAITWLLSVGDLLLERMGERARGALARLVHLDVAEAWRLEGSGRVRVAPERLRAGDQVIVDAGRRVPADGVIVSGHAHVDEKALTGESLLRERAPGDRLLAATVVADGQVVLRVERTGRETSAARIVRILEEAGAKPTTLQRDVERAADRLVLPTFGLAGGAFGISGEIGRATSVLITDFGTGVRVALPIAALTAVTLAARQGILVKGAQYLERLARADLVVFDKTGTLTVGAPTLLDVLPVAGQSPRELLALCAAVEAQSTHPVAAALARHAAAEAIAVPPAELSSSLSVAGRGVEARVAGRRIIAGNARWLRERGLDLAPVAASLEQVRKRNASSLVVAGDDRILGVIAFGDRAREESAAVLRALCHGGRRRAVLLSGDAQGAVDAIAQRVGIHEAYGELLPEEKAEFVRARQREGRVVALVGDGLNDAPALALADVGVSLAGSTDIALEAADVILLEGGLRRLPDAFAAADRAMRRVKTSLGFVLAPNGLAIVLAALGLLPPGLAAAVNNGSTVAAALAGLLPLATERSRPPEDARNGSRNGPRT